MSTTEPAFGYWDITNGATGGDCNKIGKWAALTCTLGQDLKDGIKIHNNGITLDGNGHTMNGTSQLYGVIISGLNGVTIKNVIIANFSVGIYVESGKSNTITKNSISNSTQSGILLNQTSQNTIESNNILFNSNDGIQLLESNENTMESNHVTYNGPLAGIYLKTSDNNNFILSNFISNPSNTVNMGAMAGVEIKDNSAHNLVEFNTITKDRLMGVQIFDSSSNDVTCNDISSHGAAVMFGAHDGIQVINRPSISNQIYMNNFLDSDSATVTAVAGTNKFDLPKPIGGNYWDVFSPPAAPCPSNDNVFCNTPPAPYAFPGDQDNIPRVKQILWKTNPNLCMSNLTTNNLEIASAGETIPEFPFTLVPLLIGFASLLIFYRIKFKF
ncbi:MAG: right-handed parallel beta-helix repeat-containing protein [Nitrosotalea sp.]